MKRQGQGGFSFLAAKRYEQQLLERSRIIRLNRRSTRIHASFKCEGGLSGIKGNEDSVSDGLIEVCRYGFVGLPEHAGHYPTIIALSEVSIFSVQAEQYHQWGTRIA